MKASLCFVCSAKINIDPAKKKNHSFQDLYRGKTNINTNLILDRATFKSIPGWFRRSYMIPIGDSINVKEKTNLEEEEILYDGRSYSSFQG